MRILKTKRSFRKEFRRQLRFAIAAAVGFTIAFSWRNAVYNSTRDIIVKISDYSNDVSTEIVTALFVTFLGVIFILISSRLLREK